MSSKVPLWKIRKINKNNWILYRRLDAVLQGSEWAMWQWYPDGFAALAAFNGMLRESWLNTLTTFTVADPTVHEHCDCGVVIWPDFTADTVIVCSCGKEHFRRSRDHTNGKPL